MEVNKDQTPFHEVKSWHCIDSKPLFDSFVSSLDVRGIRENKLFDELVGDTNSSSRKRNLYDSNRKTNLIASYKKQEAELNRRLDNAMIAKAESSRRSGRLATTAKVSTLFNPILFECASSCRKLSINYFRCEIG